MTFLELTSFIAAVSGMVAATTGCLVYIMQRKANMRPPPIIEVDSITASGPLDDVAYLYFRTETADIATPVIEHVSSWHAIFKTHDGPKDTIDDFGNVIHWPEGAKSKNVRRAEPICTFNDGQKAHYFVFLSSSAKRASISFTWRWNDESRLRSLRKNISIPKTIKS